MSNVRTDKAIAYLRQFPQTAHGKLLRILQVIGFDLQGYIQRQKLQGQVLNHRSGWLSSHVVAAPVEDLGTSARVTVGVSTSAVPYAAIHEFGFHGTEQVKAHTRIQTMCFGRSIEPVTVEVGAFSRVMNMPERSYMRSSLRERRAAYLGMIRKAVAA